MSLKKNIGLVYLLLPYITPAKNKIGLIFSILFSSNNTLRLKNKFTIEFNSSQFEHLMNILGILTFATSYEIKTKNELEFSLDIKNKFTIKVKDMSYEDYNILELFFGGIRYGANFVQDKSMNFENFRDKTLKIFEKDDRKIVETSNGIKFYIDSIHPGNTIIETFLREIHKTNSQKKWDGRIVVDVGAECGDTPLYFASMGATVYAFEPIEEHFNFMLENIKLNPSLKDKIVPINGAIGRDEILTFYQSGDGIVGNTSFVKNLHGSNVKEIKAKGYSLETALKEFNIEKIDFLKMDCKGCEFLLTENALENVDSLKIEYTNNFDKTQTLSQLLDTLERSGFEFMTFSHNPMYHQSFQNITNVYAKKNKKY